MTTIKNPLIVMQGGITEVDELPEEPKEGLYRTSDGNIHECVATKKVMGTAVENVVGDHKVYINTALTFEQICNITNRITTIHSDTESTGYSTYYLLDNGSVKLRKSTGYIDDPNESWILWINDHQVTFALASDAENNGLSTPFNTVDPESANFVEQGYAEVTVDSVSTGEDAIDTSQNELLKEFISFTPFEEKEVVECTTYVKQ